MVIGYAAKPLISKEYWICKYILAEGPQPYAGPQTPSLYKLFTKLNWTQ